MNAPCTCRAEDDSAVEQIDRPPVRAACTPVMVEFTQLETDHLPARETREQEISGYKRKAQVGKTLHVAISIAVPSDRLHPDTHQQTRHLKLPRLQCDRQVRLLICPTSINPIPPSTPFPLVVPLPSSLPCNGHMPLSTAKQAWPWPWLTLTLTPDLKPFAHKTQEVKASADSVNMSERQPLFLKDKGDAMHRSGNYRAAINAYTKAVEIDGSIASCYANRAASHLKLQEFR